MKEFENFDLCKEFLVKTIQKFPHMEFKLDVEKAPTGLSLIFSSPKISLSSRLLIKFSGQRCYIKDSDNLFDKLTFISLQLEKNKKRQAVQLDEEDKRRLLSSKIKKEQDIEFQLWEQEHEESEKKYQKIKFKRLKVELVNKYLDENREKQTEKMFKDIINFSKSNLAPEKETPLGRWSTLMTLHETQLILSRIINLESVNDKYIVDHIEATKDSHKTIQLFSFTSVDEAIDHCRQIIFNTKMNPMSLSESKKLFFNTNAEECFSELEHKKFEMKNNNRVDDYNEAEDFPDNHYNENDLNNYIENEKQNCYGETLSDHYADMPDNEHD
ncbi:MAG: hypothetical protein QNK36_00355 [Colwellia sp.]|nr:hypothetical protein [Colwellia sp.]